jgi:hypothetical protein
VRTSRSLGTHRSPRISALPDQPPLGYRKGRDAVVRADSELAPASCGHVSAHHTRARTYEPDHLAISRTASKKRRARLANALLHLGANRGRWRCLEKARQRQPELHS